MALETEVRLARHALRQFERAPPEVRVGVERRAKRWKSEPLGATFIAPARIPAQTRRRWENKIGALGPIFKDDLPLAWRAVYTVVSDRSTRVVLVLEVVSHTRYDRMFGYG